MRRIGKRLPAVLLLLSLVFAWPGSTAEHTDDLTGDPIDISESCDHEEDEEAGMLCDGDCVTPGELYYVCKNCGKRMPLADTSINPDVHKALVTVAYDGQEPTCTATGLGYTKCTACDKNPVQGNVTIPINSDAHDWDEGTITTAATCSAKGVKTYTCKNNKEHTKTEDVEIDENAHDWDEGTITTAATCSAKGVKTYTCKSNKEHTKTEDVEIDENAHDWDEGTVTTPATCSAKGVKTYTCKNNKKHTKTEPVEINPAAHTPGKAVKEKEVAATCQQGGSYDSVVYCTACGTELSRETVKTEKAAHNPGEEVRENNIQPTYVTTGSYELVTYCTRCEKELSRTKVEVPILPRPRPMAGAEAAIAAAEAARAAAEAARAAAAAAAAAAAQGGNIPTEPATTRPVEAPTRPAPAPVPVPAPQRPAAPAAPAGTPAQPNMVIFEIAKIMDSDAFMEILTSELAKDGKTPVLDADSLKAVLENASDSTQKPTSVESVVKALGGDYKSYRSNGKEAASDPDLSEYHFLCSFEQLKLQSKQTTDRYGNPQPFEITTVFPVLADLKAEEIANTIMMVYDPSNGEIALVQLEAANLDTSKNPPEVKVTLPFPGLFTFIQK